ncbi:MAG: CBS domain-containing protein, partial [Clostridia bacterium]|nr:CBS domain-containing protein [Clostridia bacterium]
EMIPKCFARSCNEGFALNVSGSLLVLMKLLKPLSWFFTRLSKAVSAPFIKRAEPEVTMTVGELHDIVENISPEDGIDAETGELVRSALRFSDRTTGEVMVPWQSVQTVSVGMKTPQILEVVQQSAHSRLPVIGRDGSVRGILQIRRFMHAYIKNHQVVLASVMDYPYYIKPDIPIDDALTQMSNHRRNLAVVKSEAGEILGILTVEDILEELVGEIYDENDVGGDSDA